MNHDEIRKYIVLFIALGLLITGIVLLTTNLPSEGTIDITTPLLSGKITSGNVGILIIFLSIVVIALALKTKKQVNESSSKEIISNQSKFIYRLVGVILGWVLIAIFGYGAYHLSINDSPYTAVVIMYIVFAGVGMIFATIAFIGKSFSDD